jgi:uncharacterized membrane protein
MHNDLIIMTFDREEEAQRVYDSLRSMRKSPLLGLENTAMVTVDSAGSDTFHQKRKLPRDPKTTAGDVLSLMADLIFGNPSEETLRALTKKGLDEGFVEKVGQTMGKNSSALLFLVDYNSMSDTSELLSALALFRGKIHQTTLSSEAKGALRKT